jgi:hypothetical protein
MDKLTTAAVGLLLATAATFALAQPDEMYPGRNANIVGPPPAQSDAFPDVGYRQQNEPSCAVNPENPSRVCCGFNDYRGIDIPGLEDAWQGIACSIDGGGSWNSQLIPGHKLDPDHSLGLSFAADPGLVSVPGGLVFNYIAANRDQIGGLYVQRFLWRNKEDGWPLLAVGGPVLVSSGNSGRFIDKPHFHAFLDDNSSATVTWTGTDRELPAGTLGLSAAVFVGNDNNDGTKLLYWRSNDWGETWENPTKLSESKGTNSGVNLAANGDTVCAIWRRFDDTNEANSILKACSINRGKTFAKAKTIADICPFDQTTLNGTPPLENFVSFRSNAFPVIAADGNLFYAFWSDRGYASASDGPAGCELVVPNPDNPAEELFNPSFGRIVYSVSSNGGNNWSAPQMVEDHNAGLFPGHQFMPAVYGSNGEVLLAWLDSRDDIANQFRAAGFDPDVDKQLIVDFWDNEEPQQALYRHSTDIRSVRLKNGSVVGAPNASVKVSSYANGLVDLGSGLQFTQLEYNLVNARLFQQGFAPFIGDYLHVIAQAYNQDSGGSWKNSNTVTIPGSPIFHVTWGSNRDVRGNAWGGNGFADPSPYTPVGQSAQTTGAEVTEQTTSNANPTVQDPPDDQQVSCEAAAEPADRTRDQNVYSAPVYPAYTMSSPGAIKLSGLDPTGLKPLRRAIPIIVSNNTASVQDMELSILAQPEGGKATFSQDASLVTKVSIKVWGGSSAVRTVFVSTPLANASTTIPVTTTLCAAGSCSGPAVAQVVLNEDPLQLEQPDFGNSSILAQETHDPAILNPGLLNPDVVRLLVQDPSLVEILITAGLLPPGFTLADLFNGALVTPDLLVLLQNNSDILDTALLDPALLSIMLANPELLNRALLDLDVSNPNLLNPNLLNPNLLNQAFWDLLRESNNLDLLVEAVANPNLLNDLVQNPNLLNPNLLNLVVENPNLLNPNLLNILVSNPNLLNFELENPNLLNPNLLNLMVSNPNLLNTSVNDGLQALALDSAYPVTGSQADQLAYVQANYAANLDLINAVISNPNLLNPNLLNPNLLNPNLLNELVANPNLLNPNLLNPNLLNPNLLNPNLLNPNLLNPDLLNPDLLNQVLLNPNLLNLVVANPNLLNPNLLNPNLLNPNLLNQLVENPNLLNPNLLNPNLLNPNLLNPNLLNAPLDAYASLENSEATDAPAGVTPGVDHYIDVTWQVQNTGNTTTGYMAQPYIAGVEEPGGMDGITGSQLIVSKPYLRQTVSDCQQVLQTYNNVIVNIPNPRIEAPIENPDPTDAATIDDVSGLGSFWLAPGEVANVTMRVFGSADALISGRVGLYIVERDFTAPVFTNLDEFLEQFDDPVEATGPDGAVVTYEPPPASDEGDGTAVAVECDFDSGSTFPVGDSSHVCVASDSSGNEAEVGFDVTVEDSLAPVLVITPPSGWTLNPVVEATGADGVSVDFSQWVFSATDVNGVDPSPAVSCIVSSDPNTPTVPLGASYTLALGVNTLACNSTDASGNISEPAIITIDVRDTTPPVLTIPAPYLIVSAEAMNASGATVAYDVENFTIEDLVDGSIAASPTTVSCAPASGSTFMLGSTTVSCSASDSRGNSSDSSLTTFQVSVADTTPPNLVLPAPIVVEAASAAGATVGYVATATDQVDASVSVGCAPPPGEFPIGVTIVSCSAIDDAGNSSAGSFSVTVQDTTAPVINLPVDITLEADGPGGSLVSYVATATDLGQPLAVSCTPASGSVFPIGATVVSCGAADPQGNLVTGSFSVTVEDTLSPVLVLPDDLEVQADDENGAVVSYSVTATDVASSDVTVDCAPASDSLFEVGTTTVSCTATDAQGLQSSGSFSVTVSVPIVWLEPLDDPHYASIGPNLNLRWGYGTADALIDSRHLIDKPGGKGTDPVEITYLSADSSCAGAEPMVVNLDAGSSSLRYSTETWLLNWQTGQSDIPGDGVDGLVPGCYEVSIPRISGVVDNKTIILN